LAPCISIRPGMSSGHPGRRANVAPEMSLLAEARVFPSRPRDANGRIESMRVSSLLLAAWLMLFGDSLPLSVTPAAAQTAGGRVLAVVGRQVSYLNFEAPRPRALTTFSAPAFAMDIGAVPSAAMAVVSVAEPLGGQGQANIGGDLLGLDLSAANAQPAPFLMRDDANEWLGAPVWLPDASAVLFQREDVQAGSD